jgi:transposase
MNAEQLKIFTIATHTPREAATILGVHIRTVRYHKQRMEGKSAQLKEPTGYKKWTQKEDNYLLTFGNHSTYPELQECT